MLTHLAPVDLPGHSPVSTGNEDHPMRHATRRAAGLQPGGWTADLASEVGEFFDGIAGDWHTRDTPERLAVVSDAIERGLSPLLDGRRARLAVEVGSGTGYYSSLLLEHAATVLAVELSEEMHRNRRPTAAAAVLADASRLPIPDSAADAVVMINAFLFPEEVSRVLRPGGVVLWVNSGGPDTPIYLHCDDVVAALPFTTTGVESGAGAGTWCALRHDG